MKWKEISQAVRYRDNSRCVLCGAPVQAVHHIDPVSEGGESFATNLVSLCYRCHNRLHYGLSWWHLLVFVPIIGWILLLIRKERQRQKLRDIARQHTEKCP